MSKKHEVALVEVKADRTRSADKTDIQKVDCTVQVVVETANKCVNANKVFTNFRLEKETHLHQADHHSQAMLRVVSQVHRPRH